MYPLITLFIQRSLLSSSPSNVGFLLSSSLSNGRSSIPSLNQSMSGKPSDEISPSRIPIGRPSSIPSYVGVSWSSSTLSNSRSSMPSLNESMTGIPSEAITPSRITTGRPTFIPSEMVSAFRRMSEFLHQLKIFFYMFNLFVTEIRIFMSFVWANVSGNDKIYQAFFIVI